MKLELRSAEIWKRPEGLHAAMLVAVSRRTLDHRGAAVRVALRRLIVEADGCSAAGCYCDDLGALGIASGFSVGTDASRLRRSLTAVGS